jgi:hypothetical protein
VRRLLARLRPDVLLLSGFVAMSGAGALPQLLGLRTRLALAYTIPMAPTAEFGMPLAGMGFTAPAAWLNRLQWEALRAAVSLPLHKQRAQGIVDAAAAAAQAEAEGSRSSSPCASQAGSGCPSPVSTLGSCASPRIQLGSQLTPGPVPTLYIYSPALLPKPADWPASSHVVGPLLLRRGQAAAGGQPGSGAAAAGLPLDLQAYLDAAARAQLPVVYIGLGSMLGTVFEGEEVQRLVGCMQAAVEAVHADTPLAAVIHTTLQPGCCNSGRGERALEPGQQGAEPEGGLPPHFTLQAPVPHDLLLPQCDLIVHHGGAGTTQAALLAGARGAALRSGPGRGETREPAIGCRATFPGCVVRQSPPFVPISLRWLRPLAPLRRQAVPGGALRAVQRPALLGGPDTQAGAGPALVPWWGGHRVDVGGGGVAGACWEAMHAQHACHDAAGNASPGHADAACSSSSPVPHAIGASGDCCIARPPPCAVRRLTADRLARGIRQGLLGLRRYTAEAEALAYHMSREDGVATAASIIERLATEA